ncbi:hypothetical protein B0O99DRAFT_728327 [Bisporella sp. PMI_857]|nr:hypothetical protein B0O99DRAFT_728327 [Bisporella sp. PMI_857]
MIDFLEYVSQNRLDELNQDCCSASSFAKVSILETQPHEKSNFHYNLNFQDLEKYLDAESLQNESWDSGIFFISTAKCRVEEHTHIDPTMKLLYDKGVVTAKFLVDFYETDDWTVFRTSSSSTIPKPRQPQAFDADYEFDMPDFSVNNSNSSTPVILQYGFWIWSNDSIPSFVQLIMNAGKSTYFFVNFPSTLQEYISITIEKRPSLIKELFFIESLIVIKVLASYHSAIASHRETLRGIEQKDIEEHSRNGDHNEHIVALHKLAVKWHTILKDLTDIEKHLDHLLSTADRIARADSARSSGRANTYSHSSFKTLRHHKSSCQIWSQCVRTYSERTNIRINLVHNLAAREDNQANQRISRLTTDIALQTKHDSASMSTLAMVTALFLPGTFVCSVFSTALFAYEGGKLDISHWWWILPTIAVPLIILVMYTWFLWFRTQLKKDDAFWLKRREGLETGDSDTSSVSSCK